MVVKRRAELLTTDYTQANEVDRGQPYSVAIRADDLNTRQVRQHLLLLLLLLLLQLSHLLFTVLSLIRHTLSI